MSSKFVITWRGQTSLFITEGIRSFAMGYFSIIFVVLAQTRGLDALGLGMVTGITVAIGIVITHYLTLAGSRYGVRVALAIAGGLMAATGILMVLAHSVTFLYIGAFLGFLPPNGGMFIGALAEGLLAQTHPDRRTKVFVKSGLTVTVMGALGALFASFPASIGLREPDGLRLLTWVFVALGIAIAVVGLTVIDSGPIIRATKSSSEVDDSIDLERPRKVAGSHPDWEGSSTGAINRLALLFVLDSAGSGVVASTLMIYWLRYRFHFSVVSLSLLFFGMDILSAVSFPLAERISRRIGLLNTAVFTHIPSSLLLVAVPFAPAAPIATLLLLLRSVLVEMDVPTRKSYIASIVQPEERRKAAARTSIGRQAGRAVGPAIGGFVLSNVSATAPFLIAGVLKIFYDLSLWRSFRKVRSREEAVQERESVFIHRQSIAKF